MLWVWIVLLALGILADIALIGKVRPPRTSEGATTTLVINLAFIVWLLQHAH